MNLEELQKMGKVLEHWLRMRGHPVAIKMLKNRAEIPEGAIIPTKDWKHKYSMCQSWARSQRRGETIVMFKEDNWCPEPVIGFGLAERVPYFLEGHHRYPDSIKELKESAEWCNNMPFLEHGFYEGVVSAPLKDCAFAPDLILMHINGMMTSQLLIIQNWINGRDIYAQLSGHAACVYSVVPSLLKNECNIAIPCRGDRTLAGAQDDEIIFTLVPEMLPSYIEGINWLQENGWGIPLIDTYKEEHDLRPKYKILGKKVGMDMSPY